MRLKLTVMEKAIRSTEEKTTKGKLLMPFSFSFGIIFWNWLSDPILNFFKQWIPYNLAFIILMLLFMNLIYFINVPFITQKKGWLGKRINSKFLGLLITNAIGLSVALSTMGIVYLFTSIAYYIPEKTSNFFFIALAILVFFCLAGFVFRFIEKSGKS